MLYREYMANPDVNPWVLINLVYNYTFDRFYQWENLKNNVWQWHIPLWHCQRNILSCPRHGFPSCLLSGKNNLFGFRVRSNSHPCSYSGLNHCEVWVRLSSVRITSHLMNIALMRGCNGYYCILKYTSWTENHVFKPAHSLPSWCIYHYILGRRSLNIHILNIHQHL